MLRLLYGPTLTSIPDHWKNHRFDRWTFVGKVMSLLFNTQFVIVCHSLPSKEQASFNFMATVTIRSDSGAQENQICHCFYFSPFYLPWSDGIRCHERSFLDVEFQASFSLSYFTSSKGSLVPLWFLPLECLSSAYLKLLILVLLYTHAFTHMWYSLIHCSHHPQWCSHCPPLASWNLFKFAPEYWLG